jgi:hypothetical protein
LLGPAYTARLCEYGLDFIACGEQASLAVKNHPSLRSLDVPFLLLPGSGGNVMVTFKKLQIETPTSQGCEDNDKKNASQNGQSNSFQN